MDDSFENKLLKVDLLDIYDDIAAIEVTKDQLIQLCTDIPCSVDLTSGNVVYAVEEKYKAKLSNYKKSKRLKWLKRNLKSIIPNPEEKYIKWQKKHHKNQKYDWVKRKLLALDYLTTDPLLICSEQPCCSKSLAFAPPRQLSERQQSRRLSSLEASISTVGNTSSESLAITVIPSQQRSTQGSLYEVDDGCLLNFRNVSMSTSYESTEELPSPVRECETLADETEADSSHDHGTPEKPHQKYRQIYWQPLIQQSDPLSSQEASYDLFYQDMHVTSTQEFG